MPGVLARQVVAVRRLGWRWWLLPVPVSLAGVALASWWFTEPLDDPAAVLAADVARPKAAPPEARAEPDSGPPAWPEVEARGPEAKARLLAILEGVTARLDGVEGYTAVFHKQERLGGKLGPKHMLEMKVRHRPFAIYFKFLEPQAGKEVVYAQGHHGDKLIAHGAGVARLLVPRLAVPPDHPLALADSRHPVTEAGLANLTRRLVNYRKLDLADGQAETVLDRTTDPQGRPRLRSVHTHPGFKPERPFARVEVLYDPETLFPLSIKNFDWPAEGHTGELLLAEHYVYDRLNLDAALTALDFDPANPQYSFHRY